MITGLIDSTATGLEDQRTEAQKQLDALTAQTSALISIQESTELTANLMLQLVEATKIAEQQKLALPTVPEFSAPVTPNAPVPTDSPIANMTNMMVKEIEELRVQIAGLREDQQKQTGDLIGSSYDIGVKTAEQIATAIEETSSIAMWRQRNSIALY
jgi:hypothetical protein